MPNTTARALARADALANRLYGSRYNPLHQSGAITIALLIVLVVTGVYLLLFYRVGDPHGSVARITEQRWLGAWIRTLHRYASDAALVAAGLHALRMFAQRRSWGRRTMPWLSGLLLFGLILVCGWTGFVMIWDDFGRLLAVQGARLIDLVPLFSDPISRAFVGDRDIPAAFFFLNLFLHIVLPIGLAMFLWLHVSRVARPVLLPPRRLLWGMVGVLTAVSLVWPIGMAPEASVFRVPDEVDLNVYYGVWILLLRFIPPPWFAATALLIAAVLVLVPRLTRPGAAERLAPSAVDERRCTGCRQCALDCPYEAISMIARGDGRAELVARVDAERCVSCGICAGSCAPMGVGPTGRTGRDQLERARQFAASCGLAPEQVVVIACARGGGGLAANSTILGAAVHPIECAGALHTSVIEYFLRAGAGGVLVASCHARDCWNREGAVWLEQRLYHDREAELQARVNRRRVALVRAGNAEPDAVLRALAELQVVARELARPAPENAADPADLLALCEAAQRARLEA